MRLKIYIDAPLYPTNAVSERQYVYFFGREITGVACIETTDYFSDTDC